MINDISISNVGLIDKRILTFDNRSLLPCRGIVYIKQLRMSFTLHRSDHREKDQARAILYQANLSEGA